MTKRKATAPADAAADVVAEQPDEFHGQGGSYVVDPETGRRVLVERTKERGEVAPPTDKE